MKRIAALLLMGLFLYACAKVPLTGRKQLDLVPSSELLPMSFSQYQNIMDSVKLADNTDDGKMVKKVGARIAAAVQSFMQERGYGDRLQGFDWEFHLIQNDTVVNAWCMPGGKVAFYSAILPICKDEAGVAVVMGHEVAHAVANHSGERMSNALALQLGISSLQVAMGQNPSLTQKIFLQSVGIGSQLGMLKFSRTHESEADKLGLYFMAIAGYDPHEAVDFWKRMSEMSGGNQPPEFLSTHPSHETRVQDIESWLPEAMKYYKPQN